VCSNLFYLLPFSYPISPISHTDSVRLRGFHSRYFLSERCYFTLMIHRLVVAFVLTLALHRFHGKAAILPGTSPTMRWGTLRQ
jgi:hypothetical protein